MRRRRPGTLHLGNIVNGRGSVLMGPEERRLHTYVVGTTGTGKSKLLENLLRQDILDNVETRSGLVLMDSHGNLYDDLMRWMTTARLKRRVVPIDLRRDDWIVAYNLLRRRLRPDGREVAASVVIDSFVRAMAHAWGAEGTDETPLLARWISAIMHALYERGLTITDSLHLTDRMARDVREFLTQQMSDPIAARHWQFANAIRPTEFDQQVSSSINRLERFLHGEVLPKMFGQVEVSFDFGPAMDEGWIVLVNLSTEGGNVSAENARVFGTLMLTDLWECAKHRGKREGVKPFYVYLDEFQKFITPDIAENLDEARGFGLWLTMAHQFPAQLLHAGPAGEKLYDSVMENARNKVVFCLQNPKNLEPLAHWLFMGTMNPDEIKHVLWSTKVMDYRVEYMRAYGHSSTSGSGGASQHGRSTGSGLSTSTSRSGAATYDGDGHPVGSSTVDASVQAWQSYFADNYGEAYTWQDAHTDFEQWSPMLIPVMGKEISSVQFRDLNEQLFRAMAVLFDQQQRQAVVRLANSRTPVSIFTPTITEGYARKERVQAFIDKALASLPFALPFEEAKRRIDQREQALLAQVRPAVVPRQPCATIQSLDSMSDPITVSGDAGGTVVLQPRDLALLFDVFDNRFITISHAQQLHFPQVSRQAAERRLQELARAGLVIAQATDLQSPRTIYRPTRKAIDTLSQAGAVAAIDDSEWQTRQRKRCTGKLASGTLRHEIAVLDVKSVLAPAINSAPGGHLRVVEFGIWPDLYKFDRPPGGKWKKLDPDGFLHVSEHAPNADPRDVYFYLELDQGSNEKRDVLIEKIDAYKHHLDSGGFARWLGRPDAPRHEATFRVLIVITTADAARRRDNLLTHFLTQRPTINSLPWLTTLEMLKVDPLGAIWATPAAYREATSSDRRGALRLRPLFEGL